MYFASGSQGERVHYPGIALNGDAAGRGFAWSTEMFVIAALILIFVAMIVVSVIASVQLSRGIEAGSASLAESKANAANEPRTPKAPADIPIYKGGRVATAGGHNGALAYDLVFPLGSIDDVQTFYNNEMPKSGWRVYASGNGVSKFVNADGSRTASLIFKYYGGSVRLRLLTSQ